ncbi:leucine-rich repeat-containing protein 66, partial [Carlito syrichta]|uniref:Leucine-rich repeat-containing protein 66 n=1 Tax=Carlito syrichta TaxID=1868482 RepID=A0A1U7ST56_CARSF
RARKARVAPATSREGAAPQNLALAVCLSVFITFLVAFCLGALTRPYVDRLWQRCRARRPGTDAAYSNEGFYDDVEAARPAGLPRTHLGQASPDLNIYENRGPFQVTEPSPHTTVHPHRALDMHRIKIDGQQSSNPWVADPRTGGRRDSVAHSVLCGHPDTRSQEPQSAAEDHIYSSKNLGEETHEMVAPDGPLNACSVGISSVTGSVETDSYSARSEPSEYAPALIKQMAASLSRRLTYTEVLRPGESWEGGGAEQSPPEATDPQGNLPRDIPGTTSSHWHEPSACPSAGPHSEPRDMGPLAITPGQGSVLAVPWAAVGPTLESDVDSDEGSLFTLSSTGSEDAGALAEDEVLGGDDWGAGEPLQDQHSGEGRDGAAATASLEDHNPSQSFLGQCEPLEGRSETLLISGLYKTQLENAPDTEACEDPLSSPHSPGSHPPQDQVPGVFTYGDDAEPQAQVAEWHCSLRDLEFANVDISP